jgi:hypothetical protein
MRLRVMIVVIALFGVTLQAGSVASAAVSTRARNAALHGAVTSPKKPHHKKKSSEGQCFLNFLC